MVCAPEAWPLVGIKTKDPSLSHNPIVPGFVGSQQHALTTIVDMLMLLFTPHLENRDCRTEKNRRTKHADGQK